MMSAEKPFENVAGVTYPAEQPIQASSLCPACVPAPAHDIEVTAENADHMAECQSAIIDWCRAKVVELDAERKELEEATKQAIEGKYKSGTLQRHAILAAKRLDFYQRMLTALEHGYQIVPSFPITAFAIRTDRKKPLKIWTSSWNKSHTQEPSGLPAGEGEYKNPFPVVQQEQITPATATKGEVMAYWASAWKTMEFPISMAKPRIMEATTRAMAMKIFDDIGILPGYGANEGTRPPRGDPIIVARMRDPRSTTHSQRWVTFIIAWHLNTKTL